MYWCYLSLELSFQNIKFLIWVFVFQLICLESSLNTVVQLECCEKQVKVSDLIPGQVSCPHGCDVFYQYSWCFFQLHDESKPRDHCLSCMKCITCEEDHSEVTISWNLLCMFLSKLAYGFKLCVSLWQICRKNRHLSGEPTGVLTRRRSQALSNNDKWRSCVCHLFCYVIGEESIWLSCKIILLFNWLKGDKYLEIFFICFIGVLFNMVHPLAS